MNIISSLSGSHNQTLCTVIPDKGKAMELYGMLAPCWPLLSPRENQAENGLLLGSIFSNGLPEWRDFLELGCGSGALASYFPTQVKKTLVDTSTQMLELCKANNPDSRCIRGDMRHLELSELFDVVLIHDALMYLNTAADLQAAIQTAADHCRPGGLVCLVPDLTLADFGEGNTVVSGGENDRLAVRLTEWHWDPDPTDRQSHAEFCFLLREGDRIRVHHETHILGLFPTEEWQEFIAHAGLVLEDPEIPPGFSVGALFLARKPAAG
jgi:SAM-dependent methyltransferase